LEALRRLAMQAAIVNRQLGMEALLGRGAGYPRDLNVSRSKTAIQSREVPIV
jgi:hypothetical protein